MANVTADGAMAPQSGAPNEGTVVASLPLGTRFVNAARDGVIGGVIALLLAFPLLTHLTVQKATLELDSRWLWAVYAFAIVALGRGLYSFIFWQTPEGAASMLGDAQQSVGKALAPILSRFVKLLTYVMLGIAIAFPILPLLEGIVPDAIIPDRRMMDLGVLVLTYVMLGWGLNIVVGLAGLLDLGYVAFYAVGAYSFALLAENFGLGFWICLPLAGILAGFWGIILGFPVLRLRGDYLAIVTLAFGEIIRVVLLNWYNFTGGPDGLSGIPKPTLFGLEFKRYGENTFHGFFGIEFDTIHRFIFLYVIILVLALITNWVTLRLRRLPIGRAWEALREDEIACRALGINVTNTKLTAFAIGAMFGGFAGSFFATRQGFISPESFTFLESAIILAIVVLGGMGSQIGVAVAAVIMIGGGELFFREFEEFRMLLFGLAMVGIMVWRPRGLISNRTPSVVLREKKAISSDMVSQGSG
ncbi:MAG: high-affinity branched-chain amino acid ABC transporter permease LivM [Pseudomonadota bacterium]